MIHLQNRYLNIGTECSYINSLTDTILDAIDLGLYSCSFSLGNSRNMMRKRVDVEDLVVCMNLTTRFPIIIFSFIPNMYNLCGSRKFAAWNGNANQDTKSVQILKEIEYEMNTLSKIGGNVIIEPGACRDKKLGLESCIRSINKMRFKMGYKLVLINSLNEFFNIGITLQDMHSIYDGIDKDIRKHIAIGLNIGHFQRNKLYNFTRPDELARLFNDFKLLFDKSVLSVIIIDEIIDNNGLKYPEKFLYDLILQCHCRNVSLLTSNTNDLQLVREIVINLFSCNI